MSSPFNIINRKKNTPIVSKQSTAYPLLEDILMELQSSYCLISIVKEQLQRTKDTLKRLLSQQ